MSAPPERFAAALASRYRLEREIGQGGMATVWLARDLRHDRDVALKLLRPELTAILGAERFLNEIRINARLDHPHILTLIDSGADEGLLWYVVPFIRGESLRHRIERERRRDTHRVTRHMAEVLANGDVVAIFPEGTTTEGHEVLPFKSSLLQPIIEAGGHVQPVAIRYRTPDGAIALAPAYVGDTSFATSFLAVCSERALTVELTAQPALPAATTHRRALARAAEASIRTALAEPATATGLGTRAGRAT